MTVKILIMAGSTRRGSFNGRLAHTAAAQARAQGANVTLVDLTEYDLPIYNADLEAAQGLPENAVKLKQLFKSHQGIFIASPEYNAGVTPLLKNTLDWLSRQGTDETGPTAYRSNVFAIASASPGALGGMRGLMVLRQSLVALGALVISEQVGVGSAHKAFAEDGSLTDERTAGFLKAQIARLIEVAGALYTNG